METKVENILFYKAKIITDDVVLYDFASHRNVPTKGAEVFIQETILNGRSDYSAYYVTLDGQGSEVFSGVFVAREQFEITETYVPKSELDDACIYISNTDIENKTLKEQVKELKKELEELRLFNEAKTEEPRKEVILEDKIATDIVYYRDLVNKLVEKI